MKTDEKTYQWPKTCQMTCLGLFILVNSCPHPVPFYSCPRLSVPVVVSGLDGGRAVVCQGCVCAGGGHHWSSWAVHPLS